MHFKSLKIWFPSPLGDHGLQIFKKIALRMGIFWLFQGDNKFYWLKVPNFPLFEHFFDPIPNLCLKWARPRSIIAFERWIIGDIWLILDMQEEGWGGYDQYMHCNPCTQPVCPRYMQAIGRPSYMSGLVWPLTGLLSFCLITLCCNRVDKWRDFC